LLSQARPAGLKQLFGQAALLELYIILTAAVVLVLGSTGIPFLNWTTDTRYPSGGLRSLMAVRSM